MINETSPCLFLTFCEVVKPDPGYSGVGTHLMKLAVSHFKGYYDIVLITNPDKGTFYKKFGFNEIYGMHIRDFTYGKGSTPDHTA